jgi:predicted transcriptional regulator
MLKDKFPSGYMLDSRLEEMEELLFVLSSANRMKLLTEIKSQDLRLTDLAERLSASVQETSKHLARLVDCKVIEKTSGGTYALTTFGKLIFDVLPSLNFVAEHRKYFLTHDLTFLPKELLLRIGQLSENRFYTHVSNLLVECQHLLGMAEKCFWWMVDEPLPWVITKKFPTTPTVEPEISVRVLLPRSTTAAAIVRAREIVGGRADFRFAEQVSVGIALNEKVAGIVFPDIEGRIDFRSGFIGYSPVFQKWCQDLFSWAWETSSPLWPPEVEKEMADARL